MNGLDLRPNVAALIAASFAVVLVSTMSLPWPMSLASIVLGVLAFAGADVDARTHHLPDTVTIGSTVCGILAASVLDPNEGWSNMLVALARALGTAAALASVRWCYGRARGQEGLGFGDVKLAAAIGAWLPVHVIPLCFSLATMGGLAAVAFARLRGQSVQADTRLPFGTFLCPALWLLFYLGALSG